MPGSCSVEASGSGDAREQHDDASEVRVDRALASLPRDVPPDRDSGPPSRQDSSHAAQRGAAAAVAAAVLLVARVADHGDLVRRAARPVALLRGPPHPPLQRGARGIRPGHALDPEYTQARQQLASMLAQRIDRLPRSARQKLEDDLAALHRASDEINAALALQPGDPLLEELLLNTYQDELAVLASVNQLANLNGAAVPEDKGIKL